MSRMGADVNWTIQVVSIIGDNKINVELKSKERLLL